MTDKVDNFPPKADDGRASSDRRFSSRHRRRWLLGGVASAALILLLLGSGYSLSLRAQHIREALTSSRALVTELTTQVGEGDAEAASVTLARLQHETESARAATTDPLWRASAHLPVLGPNLAAVTELAVSADDVVSRAVGPLLADGSSFDLKGLAPVDGRIDLAPVKEASPKLSAAAATIRLSHQRLMQIDRTKLLPEVAQPLEQTTEELGQADGALEKVAAASRLLPVMLGDEGSRNYLLLIQNSAEVRATGGIPGALAVVNADGGRLSLSAQDSATSMGPFEPAVIVAPDQALIFTQRMGKFMQSVNLTPDFPTAAQTAARMWEQDNQGTAIDGVIAIDVPGLSMILQATGPVDLMSDDSEVAELFEQSGLPTSLTAENVVPTLLSDVYLAIEEPTLQDAYFAAVARQIFEALSTGASGEDDLVHALIRSSDEGRIAVWSADETEQTVIGGTPVAGSMRGIEAGGAAFGAYFNDGTGAKMDYYMRRTVQLERSCTENGYLQYTLTATLTNAAPANAATSLPAYVTGGGVFGVPPGFVQTNFVGYGPDQSQLQTARVDGEQVPLGSHRHGHRPVGLVTTRLAPGETAIVQLDFTNVVQTSEPTLDVTPTIQPLSEVVLPMKKSGSCA